MPRNLSSAANSVGRALEHFSANVVERASLLRILVWLGLTIFTFATVFWILTLAGTGLGPTNSKVQSSNSSFMDSLYFSTVTISSLGYGDLVPIGWARLIACVEVLIGLAILGIFVAKISSTRLSFLVRRLYATDAQARLDRIAVQFAGLDSDFRLIITQSSKAFFEVPDITAAQQTERDALADKLQKHFETRLASFSVASVSLRNHIAYETENGAFFDDVPLEPIRRIGETAGQVVFLLAQLIIGLPPSGRIKLFHTEVRTRLTEALESNKTTSGMVLQHCPQQDVKNVFSALESFCLRIPEELFNVPAVAIQQPDQVLPVEGEPQTLDAPPQVQDP